MSMSIKQISLYYKDGSSDKVYHAQIEEQSGGYVVNFQYGRRGSTLTAGTKTKDPIDLEKAEKTLAGLVKEKTSKGYTEGESGAVFQSASLEERVTGVVPQLLNNVKKDEDLETLFTNEEWFMQEKFDGRRLLVKKESVTVAINKKGLAILIPEVVAKVVESVPHQIVTDGEIIGEKYYIFDILEYKKENLRTLGAKNRYEILKSIPELQNHIVPTYFTEDEKRASFAELKEKEKEGAVFKKDTSNYISGRPASGGNQLKYKFWASATVKVIKHHKTKRSVTVAVYDYNNGGKEIDMGNVTIPANYDIPAIGELVEVIYLYCHTGEKGKLFQSKYKGVRDDQDLTDCNYAQIKFKAPNEDDDEDEE